MVRPSLSFLTACLAMLLTCGASFAADTDAADSLPSVRERFAGDDVSEVPDFQKHLGPLMGKLGCNGRACHGSFQGQGGFQLSLFGYDFDMDRKGLLDRIDLEEPAASYAIQKPTLIEPHEGGKRMEVGSWEYNLFLNWVKQGAKPVEGERAQLARLEVIPSEILFTAAGQERQLQVIAVWSDGVREDVTCLSRFQSNDDAIVEITGTGLVTSGDKGDSHVVAFYDNAVVPVPIIRPVTDSIGDKYPQLAANTPIDQHVIAKLSKLGIVPSEVCDDAEFLRRVSLDLTATLPTAAEVEAFLADDGPDRRTRKIEELLERPEYITWWTTRLCDLTGSNAGYLGGTEMAQPVAQQWRDWIERRVRDNIGYDEIVRDMVLATSRPAGQQYGEFTAQQSRFTARSGGDDFTAPGNPMPHYWYRSNQSAARDKVLTFGYTFLGVRLQCAECHKHPFDQWSQQDFQNFMQFFEPVKAGQPPESKEQHDQLATMLGVPEILNTAALRRQSYLRIAAEGRPIPWNEVYAAQAVDLSQPQPAQLLGGSKIDLRMYRDPREPLVDWLVSPRNPWFARSFVNRIWANYFNVGIIDPPDDLNKANPPSNAPLLDWLTEEFIAHGYDMKWLHREILNSRTYQLSWIPNSTNRLDERNFSRAVPRRLPAEIAFDMMTQATRNDRKYAEFVTVLNRRALTIPGSALKARNTNPADYALTVFGRSIRDTNCDCDRTEEPSLLQTIFVRNDGQLLSMIDDDDGWLVQIAHEYNLPFERKSQPEKSDEKKARAGAMRRLKVQIQRIQEQIAAAEEAGKTQQAKRLHDQLQKVRRSAKQLDAPATEDDDKSPTDSESEKTVGTPVVPTWNVMEIINEAYLRTLSRFPTDDELQTAEMYISDSADPVDGVRGVLWALINTREFIVNH
ncbi:MAG: DUF1549 domain-containing protein [Planctomycetaceae bacterium]|nr:DUF1549 domain-containing protein [Planctomycetaceae bacterium]